MRGPDDDDGRQEVVATRLYAHNADVDAENRIQLGRLPGVAHEYAATDRGGDRAKKALDQCRARALIGLKVGAQVILLKNLDQKKGLVNGSRGVVTRFECKPKPNNDNKSSLGPQQTSSMPSQTSFAPSQMPGAHGSSTAPISAARPGALPSGGSTASSPPNARPGGSTASSPPEGRPGGSTVSSAAAQVPTHGRPGGSTASSGGSEEGRREVLPRIKFANGQERLISHEVFEIRSGDRVVGSRTQLPLMLGWASTIHGSQGMTLDRAAISLDRCFEVGQAYVGLSRLRSWDGLELLTFDETKISAHPDVIAFYRQHLSVPVQLDAPPGPPGGASFTDARTTATPGEAASFTASGETASLSTHSHAAEAGVASFAYQPPDRRPGSPTAAAGPGGGFESKALAARGAQDGSCPTETDIDAELEIERELELEAERAAHPEPPQNEPPQKRPKLV